MKEPWLSAVLRLGKTVENRSWAPKYRGRILLHASLKMEDHFYTEACAIMLSLNVFPPVRSELFFGGIVGSVDIVDVIPREATAEEALAVADRWGADVRWWMPVFGGRRQNGIILRNVTMLPRLIPYKGQVSLFDVPDAVVARA